MLVSELKGVGPKASKSLEKLNIVTVEDLLTYYPFRYQLIKRSNLEELKQDDPVIMDGTVESIPIVSHFGKMNRMKFSINTGNTLLQVLIFNRNFLKPHLKLGSTVTIFGKYDLKHQTIVASDIRLSALPKVPTVESVYHETKGITSKQLSKFVKEALSTSTVKDTLPEDIKEKYHFLEKMESVLELHFPTSTEHYKKALLRLKYEELFTFMLKIQTLKQKREKEPGIARRIPHEKLEEFLKHLPFLLTKDQLSSIESIYADLTSSKRMNRLLQGDVGSGKTIVAFIAMYLNYLSGYQSALMAPTEILATQHYQSLEKLLKGYDIEIGLLTGKLKASEKKKLYEKMKNGQIDMIIGTHALVSEAVEYKNLGLVITDEQHRFGVNQRDYLKHKGVTPDILYMSATPIPRTYALTIYGDMEVSSIHTMPKGRTPVKTSIKSMDEMKSVLESMLEELKCGHQIYVVAPLIEDTLESNFENVEDLKKKMEKAFGKYFRVGMLHGKMKKEEKELIMREFYENKIQILISTTVVEVGVDVGNATMIVIFDSERFGLSSLHQLRGRVGRNELQSYCILLCKEKVERLNILEQTTDGFKISEEDFRLRGSGDLFGVRQSGDMNFKLADVKEDFSLLQRAKEDSELYLTAGKI